MFIEEASLVFNKEKEGRYDLGDGPDLGFLRSARKISGDTSVILTDQTPSKLNAATVANCCNVVCFALVESKDVWTAGCAEGLKPYQRKELSELGDREVIVRLRRYQRPLKIQVDDIVFPAPLSREQARIRSKPVLDRIPFVKRTNKNTTGKKEGGAHTPDGGLPPEELRWLAHFLREPWLLTPDRMTATGLKRDADGRMLAKFEARGCIAFEGKVGAKFKLWRPTPRGLELANALGLPVGLPRKGSVAHECMVVYSQRSLENYFTQKQGELASFLRVGAASTTNGVQADILVVRSAGGRFAMQACCCNTPAYEADAVLRLQGLTLIDRAHADRIDFVLAVTVNKKHKMAIEKALKEQNRGSLPHSVVILDFDTMLDFDWQDVFDSVS